METSFQLTKGLRDSRNDMTNGYLQTLENDKKSRDNINNKNSNKDKNDSNQRS